MLPLPRVGTDAGTPESGHVSLLGRLQGGYGCREGWFGALTWGLLILIWKEEMGQAVLVLLRAPVAVQPLTSPMFWERAQQGSSDGL